MYICGNGKKPNYIENTVPYLFIFEPLKKQEKIKTWFYRAIAWDVTMTLLFLWLFLGLYARERYCRKKNKDISTVRKFYKLLILAMAVCIAINISLFF